MDANPAACVYYGCTHEELISRNITDINLLPRDQVFKDMQRAASLQLPSLLLSAPPGRGRSAARGGFQRPHPASRAGICSIPLSMTSRPAIRPKRPCSGPTTNWKSRVRERTEDLRQTVEQLKGEIEERRQTEEALAQQVTLVQDLYNNAPCGYHSLDPEGTFVQINDTELAGWAIPGKKS